MTKIHILYGTESGNAEMAAEDLTNTLNELGHNAISISMENAELDDCIKAEHIVLLSSTYGEGELPETAMPFYQKLIDNTDSLINLKFSAFGLGDSSYENFNNAIVKLVNLFQSQGAKLIGNVGKYDAASSLDVSEEAINWAKAIFNSKM